MNKLIKLLIVMILVTSLLSGCRKNTDQTADPKQGETVAENMKESDQFVDSKQGETVAENKKESDQFADPKQGETVAEIKIRDFGSIYVKFFSEAAPKAVENFTTHAESGYYDGLTFHRIIEDFMIQGGDPTGTGRGGESIWGDSFEDEFSDNLQPYRGALCMANAGPDTNTSQFFIVQTDQTYTEEMLDQLEVAYDKEYDEQARKYYDEVGGTPWLFRGHTVFGQVYDGYEVLDAVAAVKKADEKNGIPAEEVIIEFINIFKYE